MTRYVVPDECVFCGTAGQLDLAARTRGGAVVICWHCRHCHSGWPVKSPHQREDRRSGHPDRRRYTRADRRWRAKTMA